AILALLVHKLDWRELAANLHEARPLPIALALVLVVPNVLLQAVKWRVLIERAAPGVAFRDAIRSLLASFPLGLATPGRVGEAARGLYVGIGDPIQLSGSFFIDKALNAAPLLIMMSALVAGTAGALPALPWMLATFAFFAISARPARAQELLRSVAPPLSSRLGRFPAALSHARPSAILSATLLSVLIYAIVYIQYTALLRAFAPTATPAAAAAGFIAINLAGSIPATPGGLGTREAGAVVALRAFGISGAAAVNSSLLVFLLNLGLPSLIGLWIVARGGRG
ncbi:MAG: hypothetical protein CME06_13705, partial [Gemmatimonadetes bacterium]|nr:hypothetical protein [Gemmatimonadota bacterium]